MEIAKNRWKILLPSAKQHKLEESGVQKGTKQITKWGLFEEAGPNSGKTSNPPLSMMKPQV